MEQENIISNDRRVYLQDNPDYEDRVRILLHDLELESKKHVFELNSVHESYRK